MKKCPFCAEIIQSEAIKCRYCGELLDQKPTTDAGGQQANQETLRRQDYSQHHEAPKEERPEDSAIDLGGYRYIPMKEAEGIAYCPGCMRNDSMNKLYHSSQEGYYYHKECLIKRGGHLADEAQYNDTSKESEGSIHCVQCNKPILSDVLKCPYCGKENIRRRVRLDRDREVPKKELPPASSPRQSPVATPPIENPKEKAENLYGAILGEKNRIYYIAKFNEFDQQGSGLKASWNWAAFLGGGTWALYRKMYGWFFAFAGMGALSEIIQKAGLPVIGAIVFFASWIAFAIFANSLYHKSVKNKIVVAQLTINDESKLLKFLGYKGGVHTWVIWVCCLLLAIVMVSAMVFGIDHYQRVSNYNAAARQDAKNLYTWSQAYLSDYPTGYVTITELNNYGFRSTPGVTATAEGTIDSLTITAHHVSGTTTYSIDAAGIITP